MGYFVTLGHASFGYSVIEAVNFIEENDFDIKCKCSSCQFKRSTKINQDLTGKL